MDLRSQCLAQLRYGPQGRPTDGNEDEPMYDPMPFIKEIRNWVDRYFTPNGTSRTKAQGDEEGIKEIVSAFLKRKHVTARYWPLVADSKTCQKVVQWPRDRIVIRNILMLIFRVQIKGLKRIGKEKDVLNQVEEPRLFPNLLDRGALDEDSTISPLSPLSESDAAAPPLEDGSKDEKSPSYMSLDEDLITSPYSPIPKSNASALTFDDKSKDQKLPFHIADLEDTDSVSDEYNVSSTESESDIPTLEDTFKEIARKASESVKASLVTIKPVNPWSFRIFHNLEELIEELRSWRSEHDGQAPPGAIKTRTSKESDTAIRRIRFGREFAEIKRVQIDDEYIGWVLKRRDGTRIVVKPYGGNWKGWLGGDRGFSTEDFSQMQGEKSSSPQPESPKGTHNNLRRSAKKPIDYREPWTVKGNDRQLKPLSYDTEQICLDVLDRRTNVPYDLRRTFKKSWAASEHMHSYAKRSSNDNVVPVKAEPSSSPPMSRSQPHNKSSPILPMGLKPQWGLKPNIVDQLVCPPAIPAKRILPPSLGPQAGTYKRQRVSNQQIIFHFFPADFTQGAVMKSSSCCDTALTFFDSACSAYRLLTPLETPQIVAVKASWDGALRPALIPWQDVESFRGLMEALEIAGKDKNLNVDVTCIT